MMKIILATQNENKVKELNNILSSSPIEFVSLKKIGWTDEIIEDGHTIEENAWIKAETVHGAMNHPVMAEDTGLIIDALDGEPGVHSARYAGDDRSSQKNIKKVLTRMSGVEDRSARFKTVIALIINNERHQFTGICEGQISELILGNNGFGYDPIFIPEGYRYTFAELSSKVKDRISHRAMAVDSMMRFLDGYAN